MRKRLQGLLVGILIGVLLTGGLVFAKQGSEMIEVVYQNVKLYVDGVLITPKDANGNIVEPFISNGTTYLPVRALSEALGKNVSWDGSTSSVIVGLMPGEVVYFDDVIQPYKIEGDCYLADITKERDGYYIDIAGIRYYHGVSLNNNRNWGTLLYNLDSKYSQLSGMYGPEDSMARDNVKINFFGDNRLIKTLECSKNDMPKDFSVDLSGVLQLKIEISGHGGAIVNWQIK